jgi:hypothetical protein
MSQLSAGPSLVAALALDLAPVPAPAPAPAPQPRTADLWQARPTHPSQAGGALAIFSSGVSARICQALRLRKDHAQRVDASASTAHWPRTGRTKGAGSPTSRTGLVGVEVGVGGGGGGLGPFVEPLRARPFLVTAAAAARCWTTERPPAVVVVVGTAAGPALRFIFLFPLRFICRCWCVRDSLFLWSRASGTALLLMHEKNIPMPRSAPQHLST